MPYDWNYGYWVAAQTRFPGELMPLDLAVDEEGTMLNDFKIGCDPEFILVDGQGKTIPASGHFPPQGEIGYDHNGRVAEFRPSPTRGILPIVKKLQGFITNPPVHGIAAKLRAGAICNNDCLGGHIHFGFNCFAAKPPHGVGALQGGSFNARGAETTKALDVLTKALEHLDILPSCESALRRSSAQAGANYYGHFGDVRDCNGHMEYRTMASWLYDPKVAFLCLTAAKLAAVDPPGTIEVLQGCASFAKFRKWLENYATKDINATRASEKLLDKGLSYLQVDPSVDFKERWERLGL